MYVRLHEEKKGDFTEVGKEGMAIRGVYPILYICQAS